MPAYHPDVSDRLHPIRTAIVTLLIMVVAGLLPTLALADTPPPVAAIDRVDPALRALLELPAPRGPYPDRTGEDVRVDLVSADVRLEGSRLVGSVHGLGAAENGAWLDLDTRGGPLPDLRLGFGRGWSREATLDGGPADPFLHGQPAAELGPDSIWFDVDLAGSDRFDPEHAGTVLAAIKSFDGSVVDIGPGGFLGAPTDDARVLFAMLEAETAMEDPDLAAALAIGFGTLRAKVADETLPLLDADVLAWYRYGLGLDAWLAARGAEWRLGQAGAFGKLVWGWPGAQTVAYGGVSLAGQASLLSPERYRYLVPSVDQLAALRDQAELAPTAAVTADRLDRALWRGLSYRTNDTLMATLCRLGELASEVCRDWRAEVGPAAVLTTVDGVAIPRSEGVSVSLQLALRAERGAYVGDCAVATSLAIWQLQALGIPAIGMGWAGTDPATPTHDVPLWLDGEVFRATQNGPGREWAAESAFVYVTLPGVHPQNAFMLAREPNGWSRGGSVAGGWTRFSEVRRILADGLPVSVVRRWVDVQAAGGWPTW